MDTITTHWAAYPRQFPTVVPAQHTGYLPAKSEWVARAFSSCNFSLILSGSGEFHRLGVCREVLAPCVITQWPGEHVRYGPAPGSTWEEFFVIYGPGQVSALRRMGLVNTSRPVWPIRNMGEVRLEIDKLCTLMKSPEPEAEVDRVDRACERLVLETLLGPARADDTVVEKIIRQLKQDLAQPWDFEDVARRHGMSASTLRRRWFEATGESPGRFLLNLRIRQACRLLAETRLSIGEIAAQTGFEDAMYFSRRFRIETRTTPSDYRRRNASGMH